MHKEKTILNNIHDPHSLIFCAVSLSFFCSFFSHTICPWHFYSIFHSRISSLLLTGHGEETSPKLDSLIKIYYLYSTTQFAVRKGFVARANDATCRAKKLKRNLNRSFGHQSHQQLLLDTYQKLMTWKWLTEFSTTSLAARFYGAKVGPIEERAHIWILNPSFVCNLMLQVVGCTAILTY